MTDAEKPLWSKVRMKQIEGLQFYRQAIIGDYIVDLYCPAAKLVVEIDGGQHYYGDGQESDTGTGFPSPADDYWEERLDLNKHVKE